MAGLYANEKDPAERGGGRAMVWEEWRKLE